eukprot:TRINITY_DN13745_c1_g1_i1.p1 TRINITY_DN13745_c1_g1~~TRINITY_DN13745_c1_g1_i1.p1  ORF type:complete len:612 (-),score=124.19 TRINITY_DN13745_c1_g1_i1:566-2146(-)
MRVSGVRNIDLQVDEGSLDTDEPAQSTPPPATEALVSTPSFSTSSISNSVEKPLTTDTPDDDSVYLRKRSLKESRRAIVIDFDSLSALTAVPSPRASATLSSTARDHPPLVISTSSSHFTLVVTEKEAARCQAIVRGYLVRRQMLSVSSRHDIAAARFCRAICNTIRHDQTEFLHHFSEQCAALTHLPVCPRSNRVNAAIDFFAQFPLLLDAFSELLVVVENVCHQTPPFPILRAAAAHIEELVSSAIMEFAERVVDVDTVFLMLTDPAFASFVAFLKEKDNKEKFGQLLRSPFKFLELLGTRLNTMLEALPELFSEEKESTLVMISVIEQVVEVSTQIEQRVPVIKTLLQIQARINGDYPNIVSANRRLIKEGFVQKVNGSLEVLRHFHLFNDMLVVSSSLANGSLLFDTSLSLFSAAVYELPVDPKAGRFCWEVRSENPFSQIVMSAATKKEKDVWFDLLRQTISVMNVEDPEALSGDVSSRSFGSLGSAYSTASSGFSTSQKAKKSMFRRVTSKVKKTLIKLV